MSPSLRPCILALLLLAAALPLRAQTNVFDMPALFPRHLQLAQSFRNQLRSGDYAALERICREGVACLPDDPTWRYNLACMLARQSRHKEALDELEKAVELGFRDTRAIAADSDLATLRRLNRFSKLLDRARSLGNQPPPGKPATAPIMAAGEAPVTVSNTTWHLDIGQFQTFFTFPPREPLTTNRMVQLPGPAGDAIRAWQAEGTAAGNAGDLYDNRDEGHSRLRLAAFPEMTPIVYSEAAIRANVHSGHTLFTFMGTPVLGNSSIAIREGVLKTLRITEQHLLGLYGRPPAEINPDLMRMAIGDEEPIQGRPADGIEPGWDRAKAEIGDLAESDEDVMSYALFPQQAREFFELRRQGLAIPINEARLFPAAAPAAQGAQPKTGMAPVVRRTKRVPQTTSLWKVSQRLSRGR